MTERRSKRDVAADEPMVAADETAQEPVVAAEQAVDEPMSADRAPEAAAAAEPEPESAPEPEPEPEAAGAEAEATGVEPEAAPVEAEAGEPIAEPIAAAAAEPVESPAPERQPRSREAKSAAEAPEAAPQRPSGPRGLRLRYQSDVIPAMRKQFEYANPNQVPRISKIVVNVGMGEALTNAKAIDAASGDITAITGQKPIVMRARRSIAQFKIRTGNPIGLKVTLRGQRMWDFLERLTMLALPRLRDFRGTPSKSFDGRGNYTLGLREQIAFPEIDYDKVDRLRGLEVSIVTTAKSDEESKRLLELLGMPFAS
jgi:large subunit ribosomal protein L5